MSRLTRRTTALRAAVMACFVASAAVPAARSLASIPGFTQAGAGPNDYTLNSNTAGVPTISGGTLTLTTAVNGETTSAFYNTPQSLTNWTASFNYTPSGSTNAADGFAFVLQNQGLNALGGGGGNLGYSNPNITSSAALTYDVIGGNGTNRGRTGLGFGGVGFGRQNTGTDTGGINLRNPFSVNLAFDNGYLTQTITQGANTITRNTGINLAARLGGTTGIVGFTGATGGLNVQQDISNFVFTNGNAPAAAPLASLISNVPQGGAGTFGVREVQSPSNLNNVADAQNAIVNNTGPAIDYTAPVINIADTDTPGRIGGDSPYRTNGADVGGADQINNVAVIATGRIRVPTAGDYTFAVASDDGFRLTVGGQRFEGAFGQTGTNVNSSGSLQFPDGRGAGDTSLGTIYLPAGDHDIQLLNWEGGGGASVEISAAPGIRDGFNRDVFRLIGEAPVSGRRFAGTVSNVQVAQFSLPVGANGAERLNDIRNRFATWRTNGTGAVASGPLAYTNVGDPQNSGGRTGFDIPALLPIPADTGGDDNDYGLGIVGKLTLAAGDTGRYTFLVRADDDSAFRIFGPNGALLPLQATDRTAVDTNGDSVNDSHVFNGCCADSFARYDLSAIGDYTFEAIQQEGGGGSFLQLYGAMGDYTTYLPGAFQILGQNLNSSGVLDPGGLQLVAVPEPGTIGALAMASLALLGRRRRA